MLFIPTDWLESFCALPTGLELTAFRMTLAMDSRLAPERRMDLKSISLELNRHGRKAPLAVSLSRLQSPQKCPVTGSITPILPCAPSR